MAYEEINGIQIIGRSPWIPISKIPTKDTADFLDLNEKYGTCGIYQVAETKYIEEIGNEVIHDKIGYTGKSGSILQRTYDIRQPKGTHGAGRYIRQNDLCKEAEVKIRYIYTSSEDYKSLEDYIHHETTRNYGFRFAWKDASQGNVGVYSQWLELSKRLTADEILSGIPNLKELAIEKNMEEFQERLNEV